MPPGAHTHCPLTSDLRPPITHSDTDNHVDGPALLNKKLQPALSIENGKFGWVGATQSKKRKPFCGLSSFNLVQMSVFLFGPLHDFHYISHTFAVRRMTIGFVRKSGYLHIFRGGNSSSKIICDMFSFSVQGNSN